MLDIRFIRENPEVVKENIKKKFQDEKLPLVDKVLELDKENRDTIQAAQDLRTQRNALSKQVGMLMGQAKKTNDPSKLEEAEALKKRVSDDAEKLAGLEKKEEELAAELHKIMLVIPTPRSWSPLTGSTWTPPAGSPATASTICWATSPASTRPCWPTAGTL